MSEPLIPWALASSIDGPPLFAVMRRTDAPRVMPRHSHARGQLMGTERGLLSVEADGNCWVVPATHAVWFPPGLPHANSSHAPFQGWSLYLAPAVCATLPERARVMPMSGLLREAVARATSWSGEPFRPEQNHLLEVILDEICTAPVDDLGLPMPGDARLLKIARALSECPEDGRRMAQWADWVGMAPRTLSRRFLAETGFSFTEWRQRVRLLRALELLAQGRPVTAIALDLGYDNVSAFIALFRRIFGITPGRYQSALR